MEFQFTHTLHGVVAKCSMDHEAIARWFNSEISDSPETLKQIFDEITHCRQRYPNHYEAIFEGAEYSLYLSCEEVMVKANHLEMPFDEMDQLEEGLHYYDDESLAFCGLEDFEAFLNGYVKFVQMLH